MSKYNKQKVEKVAHIPAKTIPIQLSISIPGKGIEHSDEELFELAGEVLGAYEIIGVSKSIKPFYTNAVLYYVPMYEFKVLVQNPLVYKKSLAKLNNMLDDLRVATGRNYVYLTHPTGNVEKLVCRDTK